MKSKLSILAAVATVLGSAAVGAATVDPAPARAFTESEYQQCIAPYAQDYGRQMRYCTEIIAPRYGVSGYEYESCVWYAQTPWENAQQWCSDLFLP
jgi:hypothetical protein